MKSSHFIKGTMYLTLAGFTARVLGFFYRIFLTQVFGAEGIGLFQLVIPVFMLANALSAFGFQTALSRIVSQASAKGEHKKIQQVTFFTLAVSCTISLVCSVFLFSFSADIAANIFHKKEVQSLLEILAFAFPLSAIHSILCGYFQGLTQTKIPSISILAEQMGKVLCAGVLYLSMTRFHLACSINLCAYAVVFGEFCASLFIWRSMPQGFFSLKGKRPSISPSRELFALSLPLSTNRILLTALQSVEAFSIPLMLERSGLSAEASLHTYGLLSGIALPCILLPATITGSAAVLLVPTVSKQQASGNLAHLRNSVHKAIAGSLLLGFFCSLFFIVSGSALGSFLFHEPDAGLYIRILGLLCPFLYTSTTLNSSINGLGHTIPTLLINVAAILFRLFAILIYVPVYGIYAYLISMLISQGFSFCTFYLLYRHYSY